MTSNLQETQKGFRRETALVAGICVFLVLVVLAVFGQTAWFGFLNYDDNQYIYENPIVQKGLSLQGCVWASTYSEIGHWHPMTWLTHMADCQVYGLWAGGHHITNVVLHATASVLLFLVLRTMTGALWRSAFVAAVFAVHPLRAESVAWISERKDVLSGVFFMLTLWAYVRYVRQPTRWRYAAMAALFVLGLVSKNMLVTLPFVLLLLDWWPLGRMRRSEDAQDGQESSHVPFWGLVKEKIPLLLFSAGSCLATASVSEKLAEAERVPGLARMGNAVVTYIIYMRQMVFPAGLAAPYPYPHSGPPIWSVCAALALLVAITIVVVVSRRQRPYLLTGWLWYLGMLVPAIGIIQISYYSHADRYTYLPEIGLAMAGTWLVADMSASWKHRRVTLGILTTAVMSALMVCGYVQTSYWADGEIWWPHTLACTSSNCIAYLDWGDLLRARGKLDEAAARYREALAIQPHKVEILNNLGNVLAMKGQQADALAQYQKALAERPDFADTRVNLGNLLMNTNLDEAIAEYRKALELAPDKVEIRNNLGKALGMKGDDAGAIDQYRKILALEPKYANAHFNLGNRLLKVGRYEEAAGQYREALTLQPNDAEARNKLGKALLLKGDFESAMTCFEKTMPLSSDLARSLLILGNYFLQNADWPTAIACYRQSLKISPRSADACANLGTALCKKGDYREAIDAWRKSLEINPDNILVLNNLAHFLADAPEVSLRDGAKAVVLAKKADQLSGGGNPVVLETLAVAYEQAGSVQQAAETARRAMELALAQNNRPLAATLKKEIIHYETNAPAPSGAR